MLMITEPEILMGQSAPDKQTAITTIISLLEKHSVVQHRYLAGMQIREQQHSTNPGNGIAIPHGTVDTRNVVKGDQPEAALQAIEKIISAALGE